MPVGEWFGEMRSTFTSDSVWSWLAMTVISVIITLTAKLILRALSARFRRFANHTASKWDDVIAELVDRTKPSSIFVWTFFLLTKPLDPSPLLQKIIMFAVVVSSMFQIAVWGFRLIYIWNDTVLREKMERDPSSASVLGLLHTGIQAIFITLLVMIGLSNLGVNIGALVAGLGVGGIAVALAAQNILGDLLASLSIVLDKPFVVGDFITAGAEKGTIEQVGIKTTRLRSLSGEEIIMSNKELLESRIHNYKRMRRRRVVLNFNIAYSTPANLVEQIPAWIKELVSNREKVEFDRCHLMQFGNSALEYELVFFVSSPDYTVFADNQQALLLEIFRKFAQENVSFAIQPVLVKTETPAT